MDASSVRIRRRRRPGPPPRPVVAGRRVEHSLPLLLAILAVAFGIVGMHMLGVGHHAPTAVHPPIAAHHSAPDAVGADARVGDARATTTASAPGSTAAVLVECGSDCPGAGSTGATVCVVALGLLILVRRPRQCGDRLITQLLDPVALRLIVHGVRSRALRPPSLTALGISRT